MRSTRTYNWERKRVYVEIIRKGKAHKTKLRHVDGAETARAAGALIKQEFTVFKRKLVSQTHETWDRICFLVYVRIFINFTSGNLLRMFDWGRLVLRWRYTLLIQPMFEFQLISRRIRHPNSTQL